MEEKIGVLVYAVRGSVVLKYTGQLALVLWPLSRDGFTALLQVLTAVSTGGFSTLPVEQMDAASKLVMIVSMLVGGSVGSSAGGFKLLRLLILPRLLQLTLRRSAASPHAVVRPFLAGQKLESAGATRWATFWEDRLPANRGKRDSFI